jgi:hypothetical protein
MFARHVPELSRVPDAITPSASGISRTAHVPSTLTSPVKARGRGGALRPLWVRARTSESTHDRRQRPYDYLGLTHHPFAPGGL